MQKCSYKHNSTTKGGLNLAKVLLDHFRTKRLGDIRGPRRHAAKQKGRNTGQGRRLFSRVPLSSTQRSSLFQIQVSHELFSTHSERGTCDSVESKLCLLIEQNVRASFHRSVLLWWYCQKTKTSQYHNGARHKASASCAYRSKQS